MANFVSPGVYTIEKDVSDYAPSVNPSIVGLVGFASRGPVDKATLLTSPADLIRTFGTPDLVEGGQGLYGALEILQKTNQLYYVRGATTDAADARYTIPLGTHPHCRVNTGVLNTDIMYRWDIKAFDQNSVQIGDETSVYFYRERPGVSATPGGSDMPTTDPNDFTSMDWHNAILAGFGNAFDPTNGIASYIPSGYDGTSGMMVSRAPGATTTTMSYMEVTPFMASGAVYSGNYLSATPLDVDDFTFSSLSLQSTRDGDMSQTLQDNSGLAYFAVPSGTDLTYTAPSSVVLLSQDLAASGTTLKPYVGTIAGVNNAGAYQIGSLYPGKGYNYSAVNYKTGIQYRGLQSNVVNTNDNGRFVLSITSDGGVEESYDMRIAKPLSTTSATSLWPEAVLNQGLNNAVSKYVKGNFYQYGPATTVSGINTWTPAQNFQDAVTLPTDFLIGRTMVDGSPVNSFRCLTLVGNDSTNPSFDLSGGKNGDASDYAGNLSNGTVRQALIGTTGGKTGIYALDQEDVPVTMAAVPGVTDQSIQNTLITLAENTQNFLAVVAPPIGMGNAQQAIAWTNGKASGRTAAINNSYAAVYWPWVKAFDAYTGSDRWYDPSIYALGQMCYTDEVADPWFAPAGLTRGRLSKPTDVEVKLNQGDRDALYGPGNVVNPVTKFTTDGIVIYGQRTAQRAATALDRINVRRLMIYLRRLVLDGTRRFVFEPNDPITWESVRNVLNPALADIQQRRGITAFQVVCDATTNTPLRVDRNELWCKVILKPTKTAEILVFELNLTNQSASV